MDPFLGTPLAVPSNGAPQSNPGRTSLSREGFGGGLAMETSLKPAKKLAFEIVA